MRPYEIMLILDSATEEAAVDAVVKRTTDLITTQGGAPGRIERWGRRKLAYEINKRTDGYYILLEASGLPTAMADLDRALVLTDEIIRHKIIRVPPQAAGRSLTAPPPLEEMTLGAGGRGERGERGERGDRRDRDRDRDRD